MFSKLKKYSEKINFSFFFLQKLFFKYLFVQKLEILRLVFAFLQKKYCRTESFRKPSCVCWVGFRTSTQILDTQILFLINFLLLCIFAQTFIPNNIFFLTQRFRAYDNAYRTTFCP